MPSHRAKRAKLVAEIAKLRKQQLEDIADATFTGWRGEREAEHRKRSDRIEDLLVELQAIDGAADGTRASFADPSSDKDSST